MNIRSWFEKRASWCPNAGIQLNRRHVSVIGSPYLPGAGTIPACGGREMVVDYHYISPRFILAGLLAFAVFSILFIICFFIPEWRPALYLLTALSFITYALVNFYLDMKRAVIEFLPHSVVLQRPLFRPIIFEKDAVRVVEMKKTRLPVPRRVIALFYLLMVSAVFFSMTWGEVLRLMSGQSVGADFAFHLLIAIGFVVFLVELCYRSFARMHFPCFLRVTLKTGESLHLYAKHPESLAAMLEADT
ncbi:hypothetical protein [Methanogenium organophilum]|uniref:DUF1673 family protein n=1 Tax=Methanogenium organophilum TaxID=2199 RepID=A0A9X9T6B3_METOG|nr:hypothetical protein [Methanogenium organophilum]WAI00218.1 hypothetical protein OU421_07175 [Methanogenium organophilum]